MKLWQSIKDSGYSKTEYLLVNYFWLITVSAVFWHVTNIGWLAGLLLPIIIYGCLFFDKSCKKNKSILDTFWWIIFIWDMISLLINIYPSYEIMAIRCLTSQIAYMMPYWIVRKKPRLCISSIITYGYIPFVIVCILGFVFYVNPPSWYINTDAVTSFEEMQSLRLRSVFPSSYNISYFGAILLMYEFLVIAKGVKETFFHYTIIIISVVAIFLTTQRAPIVSMLVGFCVALFYAVFNGKFKNMRSMTFLLGGAVLTLVFIISNMDSSTLDYFIGKYDSISNSNSGYIQERLILNKGESSYTLLGEGVGRHNFYADLYPPNFSMRDGEYIKLLIEQGYIGAFLNILFWGAALFKSIFNFKNLTFELCLLIMLGICMIGANPLSTADKYPFIFWMAAGQIANFNKYGKNKYFNSNSYL